MKKILQKSIRFGSMLALVPCLGIAGQDNPWTENGLRNELGGMRSRTAKHFARPDGQVSAFLAAGSIHYKDQQGFWKDIDNDIQATSGIRAAAYPYSNIENEIRTFFPADPSKQSLLIESDFGSVAERVTSVLVKDGAGKILSGLQLNTPATVKIKGNKVTYADVLPGVDMVYMLANDSRKFELIIRSAGFFSLLPVGAAELVIEEELVSQSMSVIQREGYNAIRLGNTDVLGIQPSEVYDASGSEPVMVQQQIIAVAGKFYVNSSFSLQWLMSSSRKLPIHLDPTVSYFPQNATYWTGRQTASTNKTSGYLRIAAAGTTSWSKHDISTLPAAAIIQTADWWGYHSTTNTVTKFAEARSMTVDPVTATSAQIFAEATSGTLYNTSFMWGTTTYTWHNASLNNAGISDLMAAKSQGWFAIGFTYESGSTTFQYLDAYNDPNPPYIEITYVTTPCSGTPSGNAIISPTYQLCSGESFLFGLDSFYSVSGLTYQWMASTTSSIGPFTAVSGATLESYQANNITQNTWLNLVVTCTNSAGSVVITGGSASVQPVVTNNAPYYESFEGIGMPDRLPNCSWSAPNIGSTANTFLTASTNNLLPRTGSAFAAFTTPGGVDIFYSNGIYLQTGITYSVSLWYQTDLSGGINWDDLSILYGTTQTPTGLVSIASTNGPASSVVYKPLSNTFSVPSSGLYYIAVQATSSTGSAQNLSWDDLRIEIPCSLNSPSVNIVASNTVICSGTNVILTAVGADNVVWSNNQGSGSVLTVAPFFNTLYTATGTSTLSGCSASASQFITVNPSPNISVITTPPNACAGQPLTLHAFGATSYNWMTTGGTGNAVVVVPTGNASYVVQGTNQYNCSTTYTHFVSVIPAPVFLLDIPSSACVGDMVMLNANGASSYTWMANSTYITDNPAVIFPTTSNSYTVTGRDANGCISSQIFQIAVNECVGLNEHNFSGIQVYPNPTNGTISIVMDDDSPARAVVLDITGRKIAETALKGSVSFDLQAYPAGAYYVEIYTDLSVERVKVIRN